MGDRTAFKKGADIVLKLSRIHRCNISTKNLCVLFIIIVKKQHSYIKEFHNSEVKISVLY